MKKIILHTVRSVKVLGIGSFVAVAVVITAFFLRLVIGPVDLTWAKKYLDTYEYIKKIEKITLSLEDHSPQFNINFLLLTPQKKTFPLQAIVIPSWRYLLLGELRLKSIDLRAKKLDLSCFQGKEGERKVEKKQLFEKQGGDNFLEYFITTITKLSVTNSTRFSFHVSEFLVENKSFEDNSLHIEDISLSFFYKKKTKKGVYINFQLDAPLLLKSHHLFSGRTIAANALKGDLRIRKNIIDIKLDDFSVEKIKISGSGSVQFDDQKIDVSSDIKVKNSLGLHTLKHIWPDSAAKGALDWVNKNVKQVFIEDLMGKINFVLDFDGSVLETKVEGAFSLSNGKISYLGELPFIHDISASVSFSEKDMIFSIKKGFVNSLRIGEGAVHIYDFDKKQQKINIEVDLSGQVKKVLEVINKKPLKYLEKTGLKISEIKGDITSKVLFRFPLLKNLALKDMTIDSRGSISNLDIATLPRGLPYNLTSTNLNYVVTQKDLKMKGRGVASGEKVSIHWYSNFEKSKDLENSFTVQGKSPLSMAKKFVNLSSFISSNIQTDYEVKYKEYSKKKSVLQFFIDATPLKIDLPWIFFKKIPHDTASVSGKVVFSENGSFVLENVVIKGGREPFYFKGGVKFDGKEKLKSINIDKSYYAKNKIKSAVLNLLDEGDWDIKIDAKVFDLHPYWGKYVMGVKGVSSSDFSIYVNFISDKLLVNSSEFPLGKSEFQLSIKDSSLLLFDFLSNFSISEKAEESRQLKAHYQLFSEKEQRSESFDLNLEEVKKEKMVASLKAESKGFGYFLRALDIMDNIRGGELKLDMQLSKEKSWYGKVKLDRFRILRAPAMARFLSIISIAGIANLFDSDSGLFFSSFKGDFLYENKVLDISRAIFSSPSIGVSAKGKIRFMPKKTIDISGTFSPVNFINGFISYIPIIGHIIGGGEGEGVFAFTFGVKGDLYDPEVSVNPISILTPGILRRIFSE